MIKAENIYDEAKELFASARTEVRRRTLASRAYYAGYHFLREQGLEPSGQEEQKVREVHGNQGSHGLYLRWLGKSEDRSVRRAGVLLAQIYQHRIKADYKLEVSVTQADAKDAMAVLEELIEETFV